MKTQGISYSVSAVLSGGTCSINATASNTFESLNVS